MYQDLIQNSAKKHDLDPILLTALIATESSFNPRVIRYELDYKWLYFPEPCASEVGCTYSTMVSMQKTSWGLCQIMGAIYYELQGKNWATILLEPEVNIEYACLHLCKLIKSQNLIWPADIYAAYNAGSVRKLSNGDCVNQGNVDRFIKNYENAKKI